MATTIGTFTLKGNDLGNSPYFMDLYVNESNKEYSGYSSSGGLTPDSFTNVLDEYIYLVNQNLTGTITYSLNGSGTWNAGSDTIVTITYDNLFLGAIEVIPNYLILITEEYTYPIIWECSTPITTTVCEGAYDVTLTACEDNYVIPSGLIPSSTYYFVIETNRGKRYVQAVSTNVDGDVQLWAGAPEFPVGFFTPEMFTYTCKVYTDSALTNQVQFTIDNIVYNTINLKFIHTIIVSD